MEDMLAMVGPGNWPTIQQHVEEPPLGRRAHGNFSGTVPTVDLGHRCAYAAGLHRTGGTRPSGEHFMEPGSETGASKTRRLVINDAKALVHTVS
jgi:hypothetical protein